MKCGILVFFFLFTLLIDLSAEGQSPITSNEDSLDYYYELIVQQQFDQIDLALSNIEKFKTFIGSDDKSRWSQYHSLLGITYQQKSMYDSAILCQKRALELGLDARDTMRIAKANQRLGVNYKFMGDFDLAIEYFLKAKEVFYLKGDFKSGAMSDITIAQCFTYMGKYVEAMESISTVIEEATKKSEKEILYGALIERGNAYMMTGSLDNSLSDYEKAISLMKETGKKEGIIAILGNVGGVYFYKKNYVKAIENYLQAIEIGRQWGDKVGTATATMNLAEAWFTTGIYDRAKDSLLSTLEVYKSLDSKQHIIYNYDYLFQLESLLGDYKEAIHFLQLKEAYKDSVLNESTLNRISELQTKYQTAQKEQEITTQKLEIATKETELNAKRFQVTGLIAGMMILVLFGLVFYNQYRAKQKQQLQAAVLSEKERGFESVIQATEEERQRISKDLHDGIGQQLSALKMALANVSGKLSDEEQREDLELITEQFSKSADEVRQISHQMMPLSLMENGLVEAIEDLLVSSFQFSDIKYQFEHHRASDRFDQRIEISLYRVLQELLNNIIKHSGASEVMVQLIRNKENLVLFVEDNGKGMNNTSSYGHGLLNIKSRLDMIRGSVNYEPSTNSGTSATISIPIS